MEAGGSILARTSVKQLSRGFIKPSDKQLNSLTDKEWTLNELEEAVDSLPVAITPSWRPCVADYIKHFGLHRVTRWAVVAAQKNAPERYLMVLLRRERYGK